MELTHKSLVQIAYKWVLRNCSCGVAFRELNSLACNGEYPDVIGFGSWAHSVLIEVKVSRSDFICDKKKVFRKDPKLGMGTQRYYCCPTGLIKQEAIALLDWLATVDTFTPADGDWWINASSGGGIVQPEHIYGEFLKDKELFQQSQSKED